MDDRRGRQSRRLADAALLEVEGVLVATGDAGGSAMPFDGALAFVEALRASGIAVAAVASGRAARAALDGAGIAGMLDAGGDGPGHEQHGRTPTADPAPLLQAAEQLGAKPARTLVVSAAVPTVEAGARGRFGFVVGILRGQEAAEARRHALRAAGADLVAPDLRRLTLPEGAGLRTTRRLPRLADDPEAVAHRLRGRPLSIFIDFDGTLAPIVADHREAALPEGMAGELAELARRWPTAIVSGRDLADVRGRVGAEAAYYAGSHGFDIAGPGGLSARPDAADRFLAPLDAAEAELRARLDGVAGAEIERKTFSVALHFRNVAGDGIARVEQAVDAVAGAQPDLRKGRGRKVVELQPRAEWDKGAAVGWLLENTPMGGEGRVPIYVGDDLTDEDAFAVLAGRGLSFVVRGAERLTLADHALDGPEEVRRLLRWLAAPEADAL